MMPARLFPTSLVGSYPRPDWLIDPARLSKMAPRVRMEYLPRDVAFAKMQEMMQGADIVRREQHIH